MRTVGANRPSIARTDRVKTGGVAEMLTIDMETLTIEQDNIPGRGPGDGTGANGDVGLPARKRLAAQRSSESGQSRRPKMSRFGALSHHDASGCFPMLIAGGLEPGRIADGCRLISSLQSAVDTFNALGKLMILSGLWTPLMQFDVFNSESVITLLSSTHAKHANQHVPMNGDKLEQKYGADH